MAGELLHTETMTSLNTAASAASTLRTRTKHSHTPIQFNSDEENLKSRNTSNYALEIDHSPNSDLRSVDSDRPSVDSNGMRTTKRLLTPRIATSNQPKQSANRVDIEEGELIETNPMTMSLWTEQTDRNSEHKAPTEFTDDNADDQTERSSLHSSLASSIQSVASVDVQETVRKYVRHLGMFIPGRVIKWHIERAFELSDNVCHQMFHEEFNGAVLFVDISGFSMLAEELEKGKRVSDAAKELSDEVGAALGPLVKMILEWGGDVIKFAGDAIFAVFDAVAHGNMENAVAAACLAARKMIKFSLFNASSGVKLSVHCGVGAGSIVGLHVGGVFNRWEYAITGDPVAQATAAEKAASSGEVVVSSEVLEYVAHFTETKHLEKSPGNHKLLSMLGEELGGTEIRTKRLWDELHKLNNATLHKVYMHIVPYVPRPVIQSMDKGKGVWLADVRLVVTLFVNLKGLPHHSVEDVPRLHHMVKLVQKQMYGYSGSTLCRLIVDDKGLSNLWAFGMPPYEIDENFAFRAVMAALGLHEALNKRGLTCAIGITAGRVFCGTVGGNQRSEYTLHGTQVNLAARLMVLAEDGVLCDDMVHRVTEDLFVYEDAQSVEVKGKAHPIDVFRPIQPLPSTAEYLSERQQDLKPRVTEKPASSFSTLYKRARKTTNLPDPTSSAGPSSKPPQPPKSLTQVSRGPIRLAATARPSIIVGGGGSSQSPHLPQRQRTNSITSSTSTLPLRSPTSSPARVPTSPDSSSSSSAYRTNVVRTPEPKQCVSLGPISSESLAMEARKMAVVATGPSSARCAAPVSTPTSSRRTSTPTSSRRTSTPTSGRGTSTPTSSRRGSTPTSSRRGSTPTSSRRGSTPSSSHRSFIRLGKTAAKYCAQCHKSTSKAERVSCKHCGCPAFLDKAALATIASNAAAGAVNQASTSSPAPSPRFSPGGQVRGERVCAACGKVCRRKKDNCASCGGHRWLQRGESDAVVESEDDGLR